MLRLIASCFNVNPVGSSGSLVLMWFESMKINIFSYSLGHIDCILDCDDKSFYFTGFYGNPKQSDRHMSWNLINKIASTHTKPNLNWLVGRDFNEILYDFEKSGGLPRNTSLIQNFRDVLSANALTSIPASRSKYT